MPNQIFGWDFVFWILSTVWTLEITGSWCYKLDSKIRLDEVVFIPSVNVESEFPHQRAAVCGGISASIRSKLVKKSNPALIWNDYEHEVTLVSYPWATWLSRFQFNGAVSSSIYGISWSYPSWPSPPPGYTPFYLNTSCGIMKIRYYMSGELTIEIVARIATRHRRMPSVRLTFNFWIPQPDQVRK